MHWLLTRPAGLNRYLESALTALGQRVSIMPALLVEPVAADEALWGQLYDYHALLFTSINAVECFAKGLQVRELKWPQASYLAIGKATANRLSRYGMVAVYPEGDSTSESLLALNQVTALRGQRLLLVSGEGGRGVLQPGLEKKGIHAQRLTIYRRCCNLEALWPQEKVDGVVVTSLDGWGCLLAKGLLQETVADGCVVVAGGARIAAETKKYLPTKVALSPRDEHVLSVIQRECQ